MNRFHGSREKKNLNVDKKTTGFPEPLDVILTGNRERFFRAEEECCRNAKVNRARKNRWSGGEENTRYDVKIQRSLPVIWTSVINLTGSWPCAPLTHSRLALQTFTICFRPRDRNYRTHEHRSARAVVPFPSLVVTFRFVPNARATLGPPDNVRFWRFRVRLAPMRLLRRSRPGSRVAGRILFAVHRVRTGATTAGALRQ